MIKRKMEFRNADENTAEIYLYGEVGWDFTSADFIRNFAQVKASTVNVYINSPGGDVFDGLAIYNRLKQSDKEIHVFIDGAALSAASFIAMAGDTISMASNASFMIHNPWNGLYGDYRELAKMSEILEQLASQLAGVYAARTGMSVDAVRALMDAETWYGADEAKENGFIDEIYDGIEAAACFDSKKFHYHNQPKITPDEVVNMKEVFDALKVTTESEALQAINAMQARAVDAEAKVTTLETEKTDLQTRIADYEAKERAAAVDAAVASGKIFPAQKAWALENFSAFQDLMKVTPPVDLNPEHITTGTTGGMDYAALLDDPVAMAEMRENDPEMLATLRAEWQKKGGR